MWYQEADVVVVGGGGAGVAAAAAAGKAGVSVLVLEKSGSGGGSSVIAGGNFAMADTAFQKQAGIRDSVDQMCRDLTRAAGAWAIPEIIRAYATRSRDTYDWLAGLGVEVVKLWADGEHRAARTHTLKPKELYKLVKQEAVKNGARFLFTMQALELIQDPGRRVIGVRVQSEDRAVRIRASRAVVLATGGFSHNREMLLNYHGPGLENFVVAASATHTGDGLRMALGVGADTAMMATVGKWGTPKHPLTKRAVTAIRLGAIVVNKFGKRFADESTDSHHFAPLYQTRQPGALGWQLYDTKISDALGRHYKYAMKANTLEELAAKIAVPGAGLRDTVNKYNSDIENCGHDTVFGRKNLQMGPPPRGELVKIDTPPFIAVETYPSLTETQGGLRINGKAQVMDVYGRIIPGLYAAGEIAALIPVSGGLNLGGAYIFGRIAGENAAAESPSTE